ncbi:MAG: hypothetical protein ACR2J1_01015 [Methyloceanibacter sp.]|uniref:hypothetical protein n=1 Tax=Methyloceanibacter sp. TaxID=1965321 RepID=UPI003D9B9F27
MTSQRWIAVAGSLVLLTAIAFASLFPVEWQLRTGLHWLVEHFLIYFAATAIVCVAWPKPSYVAAALTVLAALLETAQGLTADRVPDLATAISGAAAVLTAAILAQLIISLRKARAVRRDGPKNAPAGGGAI